MNRRFCILLILLLWHLCLSAQSVTLDVSGQNMGSVLKSLGLPISFDAGKMNGIEVSLNKKFSGPEEALHYLAGKYGLELIKYNHVWIVQQSEKRPRMTEHPAKPTVLPDNEGPLDSVNLDPVVVVPSPYQMRMQIGGNAGEIGVYHNMAKALPGSSDNTIYTLLRLMPGIRASGEPTQDVMVRGSGMGETGIRLGAMSLFGFQSYYDHISFVNPYMIKEIRMHYAQNDPTGLSHTGGLVEIVGIQPLMENNQFKMSVTNNTMNLFANTRMQNWGVSVGFRQTLGSTFSSSKFSAQEGTETQFLVIPDFNLSDLNLKATGRINKNDLLQIEAYGISSSFATTLSVDQLQYSAQEDQSQGACAFSYLHKGRWGKFQWDNSFTGLQQQYDNLHWYAIGSGYGAGTAQAENTLKTFSSQCKYRIDLPMLNHSEVGFRFTHLASGIPDQDQRIELYSTYVKDQIKLSDWNLEGTLKVDAASTRKIYFQPHFRLRYDVNPFWTCSAVFDVNHQFVGRAPYQNEAGGWNNLWNTFSELPLRSVQNALNASYSRYGWMLNAEVYYADVKNVRRLLETYDELNQRWNSSAGIGSAYRSGLEIYAKKHFAEYETFISYHLHHSQGIFEETGQELKGAILVDWGNWAISSDFVSGFGYKYPLSQLALLSTEEMKDLFPEHAYSRWDAALKYRYRTRWMQLQGGCSVINLLNTQNVKYQYNNERINKVASVFAQASPRTLLFHLEIIFGSR